MVMNDSGTCSNFPNLCSKHRLWVLVRTAEAVLTSTHNLCFGAKNMKNRYTPAYTSFAMIKVGFKGYTITRTCFRDNCV